MSKKTKKIDDRQLNIFDHLNSQEPPAPGSLNLSLRLRQAVSCAIKKSGKDRIDICAQLYKLTGIEVSKRSLDNWSAESRDKSNDNEDLNNNRRWGIPAELVPAFCEATGDWDILFALAEACHYKALKGKDVVRARLGLVKEEIARKQQELKSLEKALVEAAEE